MLKIYEFRIRIDEYCDYIPFVSSVTNLVDIFQKYCILPSMQPKDVAQNRYYIYIDQKSIRRSVILLVPVLGNLVIALYDRVNYFLEQSKPFHKRIYVGNPDLTLTSDKLKDNAEFMLNVDSGFPCPSIFYASDRLKDDKKFIAKYCQDIGDPTSYMSVRLRRDKEFLLELVSKRSIVRSFISREFPDDRSLTIKAMQKNVVELFACIESPFYNAVFAYEVLEGCSDDQIEGFEEDFSILKAADEIVSIAQFFRNERVCCIMGKKISRHVSNVGGEFPFEKLPQEMSNTIFSYLSADDLNSLLLTNKWFNGASKAYFAHEFKKELPIGLISINTEKKIKQMAIQMLMKNDLDDGFPASYLHVAKIYKKAHLS
jgi:hypothetical protein